MTTLARLQQWFLDQCNGDWEHEEGILLSSLDNPGWSLDVALDGTSLEKKPFDEYRYEKTPADWLRCSVKDGVFRVRCSPLNLEEGIEHFLVWAEEPSSAS